jgi:hypothetical protein
MKIAVLSDIHAGLHRDVFCILIPMHSIDIIEIIK